jgi:hypothetical protein
MAECRQMARARQGPRELAGGTGDKEVNKDFSSEFSHVTAVSSYAETSTLLWIHCYRCSTFSAQCALWGFLLEHVAGRINRSSSDLDPSTHSGISYLPFRDQVLCWILDPTVLHPFPGRCLRFIELNSY